MSKFDNYFLMNTDDAILYSKEKLNVFDENANLEATEIGDGNLNYVFRIVDTNSNKSIIIKQSGDSARIDPNIKVSTDRTRIEFQVLSRQAELVGKLVPKVYLYDAIMSACVMEDLSDHTMMRTGLINHQIYPNFAEDISTFLVNTLVGSSAICLDYKAKKVEVQQFINPELCEISELLVFTEPYNDIFKRNNVFEPIKDFVQSELYDDINLHLEVAKCKFDFMNHAQALIHGDLHTGSILVTPQSTKIFDPEFAFYGPMGYDIGNVIANLFFAWFNGSSTIIDEAKKQEFTGWIENTITNIINLFKQKYDDFYNKNVLDKMAKTEGFKEWYLEQILTDTAAVTGLEMIRRIVGLANVKDITSIADENLRSTAEKTCILMAKQFITNKTNYQDGQSFIDTLKKYIGE